MKEKMICSSCGCTAIIEVLEDPESQNQHAEDRSWYFFCPVCSSAEESEPV